IESERQSGSGPCGTPPDAGTSAEAIGAVRDVWRSAVGIDYGFELAGAVVAVARGDAAGPGALQQPAGRGVGVGRARCAAAIGFVGEPAAILVVVPSRDASAGVRENCPVGHGFHSAGVIVAVAH